MALAVFTLRVSPRNGPGVVKRTVHLQSASSHSTSSACKPFSSCFCSSPTISTLSPTCKGFTSLCDSLSLAFEADAVSELFDGSVAAQLAYGADTGGVHF